MRKYLCWLFIVMLFCVIASGGCGGGSSGGGGNTENNTDTQDDNNNTDDAPRPQSNDVAVNWQSISGTWRHVSGTDTYYTSSGSTLAVYSLDKEVSTNAVMTVSGSGNSYTVSFDSGGTTFNIESYSGSGTGYASAEGFDYEDFSGSYTVSGNSLRMGVSDPSGKYSIVIIQYVNSTHIDISVEDGGNEIDEVVEGAYRAVANVRLEKVSQSDNTPTSSDAGTIAYDYDSLAGTWRHLSGTETFYNSAGSALSVYNLNTGTSTNAVMNLSGSGSSYTVSFTSGNLTFDPYSGVNMGSSKVFSYPELSGAYTASGNSLSMRTSPLQKTYKKL